MERNNESGQKGSDCDCICVDAEYFNKIRALVDPSQLSAMGIGNDKFPNIKV